MILVSKRKQINDNFSLLCDYHGAKINQAGHWTTAQITLLPGYLENVLENERI